MTYKKSLNNQFIKVEHGDRIHFINYDEEKVLKMSHEDSIILKSYFDSASLEELLNSISDSYDTTHEKVELRLKNIIEILLEKGVFL